MKKFEYCPLGALKSIFTRFILCFPAVKELHHFSCTFSEENFQNIQQLKKSNLNKLFEFFLQFIELNQHKIYNKQIQ
eukprot:snap_masked-scaffold_9-processed-gene-13.85-mRNA-1 protein AED:1.00 eAED:1.00 QI:0/0/0/0/1/1/5/0/76